MADPAYSVIGGGSAAAATTAIDPTAPEHFDDFLGIPLWNLSGSLTTYPLDINEDHPGVLSIRTGTSINNSAAVQHTSASPPHAYFRVGKLNLFNWMVRIKHFDGNTTMRMGVCDSSAFTGASPTNGVYFEKLAADTAWFGVARAANSETRTAALSGGITVDAWNKLKIRRVDSTTIGFQIDSGTELTLASNIPTVGVTGFASVTTHTTASKQLDLDYAHWKFTGLARS